MQKKVVISISFFLLLLLGVYSFWKRKLNAEVPPLPKVVIESGNETKVTNTTPTNQNPIIQKPEGYADLSPEDIKKKFIKTRNLWIADPSFSMDEKNELILKLSEELFPDGNVPPETDADKKEQEKMAALIEKLKQQSEDIKADKGLSLEEKEKKIKVLLNQFLIDVDR